LREIEENGGGEEVVMDEWGVEVTVCEYFPEHENDGEGVYIDLDY